jgi:hypothetical protein
MSPTRRIRTFALALPVWIVMILTGGEWCLMPGSATAHPMVSSAAGAGHAAGEGHEGVGHAASGHAASEHAASGHATSGHATSEHAPIETPAPDRPSAPDGPAHHGEGGGCESQAACSIAITPAAVQAARTSDRPVVRPTIDSSERPPSLVLAPELPPPRA